MFATAERSLPMAWERARDGLERALADGGLVHESVRAEAAGTYEMPVGPKGERGPTRHVTVRVGPPKQTGEEMHLAIRWEVPGVSGSMFPSLDANLIVAPDGAGASRLSILGRYEPPLGPLGRLVDRVVMERVARATMEAFLREVAEKILGFTD